MKKIINYSLLILVTAIVCISCRKEDNSKVPDLEVFPLPKLAKEAGSDQNISAANPSAFNGKVSVGLYFPNGPGPSKFDVVVIKNENIGVVKTLQPNLTTFPSSVTVTGQNLISLFNEPIVAGDVFDIGVDVTTAAGKKYEAFPATGEPYAAGVAAQPGAVTSVRYTAN